MSKKILFFFILSFSLYSCKKELFQLDDTDKKRLIINEFNFDLLQAKSKIEVDDGSQTLNAAVNIRMKKDSIIWVSVSPSIGIEALRIVILNDSIFVIDRINKQFAQFSFDSLQQKFRIPVTFHIIQSVLLGNSINPGSLDDKVTKNEGVFLLKQNKQNLTINNFINDQSMKIEKVLLIQTPEMNTMEINYGDFQLVNNSLIPFENLITLTYKNSDKQHNTSLDISYNKISVEDKKIKFPFNIPNRYVTSD